jgi:hypothetical protein
MESVATKSSEFLKRVVGACTRRFFKITGPTLIGSNKLEFASDFGGTEELTVIEDSSFIVFEVGLRWSLVWVLLKLSSFLLP